jgi:hypothetical protein
MSARPLHDVERYMDALDAYSPPRSFGGSWRYQFASSLDWAPLVAETIR